MGAGRRRVGGWGAGGAGRGTWRLPVPPPPATASAPRAPAAALVLSGRRTADSRRALLTYNFWLSRPSPRLLPAVSGSASRPRPSHSFPLPPAPPRALPWQLNKQTWRTWGRGEGGARAGPSQPVTPARQLAGGSHADAGGGPGVGLRVPGAGPVAGLVAARPGQSLGSKPAAEKAGGGRGGGLRARRCLRPQSAIIRLTHPALGPSSTHAGAGLRSRGPVRALGLASHGSSWALLPGGGWRGSVERRRVPSTVQRRRGAREDRGGGGGGCSSPGKGVKRPEWGKEQRF